MAAMPQLGAEVAGYRLDSELGHGGMGVVFLATRVTDGRLAALKIPRPELVREPTFQRRFEREARYAGSLVHPNLIEVLDAGEHDGLPFMAMRYVPGADLKQIMAMEGPLEPARALAILRQVASALDAAHGEGLLHRDVKPGNVMVASGEGEDPPGRAYVTDFGLAKNPGADSIVLTTAGQFVGTTDYIAPEQVLGQDFDHRVDVYALGCVLYETLTGQVPFPKERDVEVLYAHLQDPPPALTPLRPGLPPAIDEVVARVLAKEPDQRYSTCTELIAAAEQALGIPAAEAVEVAPIAEAAGNPAAGDAGAQAAAGLRDGDAPVLEIIEGNAAGTILLVDMTLQIGREAPGAGHLAGDPELSRSHAQISTDPAGNLVVEDLGSTNGTFVNGERIANPRKLRTGDRLAMGRTVILVRPAPVPSSVPMSGPETVEPPTEPAEATSDTPPAPRDSGLDAPPGAGEEPAAPAPLRMSLRIDPPPSEIELRFAGDEKPVRVVREGEGWRVEPAE